MTRVPPMIIRPAVHSVPLDAKGRPAHCPICAKSRRPVGLPRQESSGWSVYRWSHSDPYVSGLATKRMAYRVLWALKHRWSSCTVTFANGRTVKLPLTDTES